MDTNIKKQVIATLINAGRPDLAQKFVGAMKPVPQSMAADSDDDLAVVKRLAGEAAQAARVVGKAKDRQAAALSFSELLDSIQMLTNHLVPYSGAKQLLSGISAAQQSLLTWRD